MFKLKHTVVLYECFVGELPLHKWPNLGSIVVDEKMILCSITLSSGKYPPTNVYIFRVLCFDSRCFMESRIPDSRV